MKKDQKRIPLIEALDGFREKDPAIFCIPGHRANKAVPEALLSRFGDSVFGYDLTEAPGLDDLHDAHGAIKEAQELLADLFEADKSCFVVNGTTAAVEAMILAAVGPGEEIILARNIHKSALSGLILSGAVPVWLPCEYDEDWHIAKGIRASDVERKIQDHPNARAVFLVSPTYYGVNSDLREIAKVCHEHGIPLLVDAAHGSHLGFDSRLAENAVAAGADLAAMSFHKTAGAMTQASVLHYHAQKEESVRTDPETGEEYPEEIRKDLIDPDRLKMALQITQSSSPSYILMASLEAARQQLALCGEDMAAKAVELSLDLRRSLEETPGVEVFGGSNAAELKNRGYDSTRVVFRIRGLEGTALKERLFEDSQIVLEMADAENAVAVITSGNTSEDILKLSMAVWSATNGAETPEEQINLSVATIPEACRTPRDAYFAAKEKAFYKESEGRICGSLICPYPPGTPLVVPGEILSREIIDIISFCREKNIPMHGLEDDGTIDVIKKD